MEMNKSKKPIIIIIDDNDNGDPSEKVQPQSKTSTKSKINETSSQESQKKMFCQEEQEECDIVTVKLSQDLFAQKGEIQKDWTNMLGFGKTNTSRMCLLLCKIKM
jgi:hypothetical protein